VSVLFQLAWVFFKIGLFSWGGGIVIVPLVEQEVVWHYGWLTQREFLDAVTLGQVTPGPVVISAAFIGTRVQGPMGALVATVSVILPSFILVCLAAKAVKKWEGNRWLMAFFRGSRAAVIGTIFYAAMSIGRTAVSDMKMLVITAISLVLLMEFKIDPAWLILAVGLIGVVI
jgi:chromate transporter